jgi:hypothetical protein
VDWDKGGKQLAYLPTSLTRTSLRVGDEVYWERNGNRDKYASGVILSLDPCKVTWTFSNGCRESTYSADPEDLHLLSELKETEEPAVV